MRHQRTASEGSEAVSQKLFRSRLDALIDLSHPLAKLSRVMPWEAIENAVSGVFPPAPMRLGSPALPIRLMAGLLYLKHAYNLSDEATCERWLENCYWQYFTGEVYFQTRLPIVSSCPEKAIRPRTQWAENHPAGHAAKIRNYLIIKMMV